MEQTGSQMPLAITKSIDILAEDVSDDCFTGTPPGLTPEYLSRRRPAVPRILLSFNPRKRHHSTATNTGGDTASASLEPRSTAKLPRLSMDENSRFTSDHGSQLKAEGDVGSCEYQHFVASRMNTQIHTDHGTNLELSEANAAVGLRVIPDNSGVQSSNYVECGDIAPFTNGIHSHSTAQSLEDFHFAKSTQSSSKIPCGYGDQLFGRVQFGTAAHSSNCAQSDNDVLFGKNAQSNNIVQSDDGIKSCNDVHFANNLHSGTSVQASNNVAYGSAMQFENCPVPTYQHEEDTEMEENTDHQEKEVSYWRVRRGLRW